MKKGIIFQAKERMAWRESLGPAMEIEDQEEANAYFNAMVGWEMGKWGKSREQAEADSKTNLGYFAGYYDHETMSRVNRLFQLSHPVFGTEFPTQKEAFNAGRKAGEAMKAENA